MRRTGEEEEGVGERFVCGDFGEVVVGDDEVVGVFEFCEGTVVYGHGIWFDGDYAVVGGVVVEFRGRGGRFDGFEGKEGEFGWRRDPEEGLVDFLLGRGCCHLRVFIYYG